MKKLIVLLLVLVLTFSVVGCSDGNTNDVGNQSMVSSETPFTTVDIMNYTLVGRFPEFDLGLGSIMGDIRAEYLNTSYSPEYKAVSGMHTLSVDSSVYYMTKEDYKTVAILTTKPVFGFTSEVTPEKLAEHLGAPVSEATPDLSKLNPYTNLADTDVTLSQTYTSGENTVVFYYLNGTLSATLIYKTGSFSLIGA